MLPPNDLVKLLTANVRSGTAPEDEASYEQEYQEIFKDEGERKIERIVERVRDLDQSGRIDLESSGYLSLGGADGSEVKAFLELTIARYGALIELSEYGTNIARHYADEIASNGKEFKVIQGDVVTQIAEAIRFFREKECSCLIVSAQAILHEIPDRSDAFDEAKTPSEWNKFFGEIFDKFPATLLFSREPCMPNGHEWQGEVEFRINDVEGEVLADFTKAIGDRMGYFGSPSESNRNVKGMGSGYVLAPGDLAVEALHKYLRNRDLTSYRYELGEQLTSFDADREIRQLLYKYCGDASNVDISFVSTQGFRQAYSQKGVSARKVLGNAIQAPKTHAEIEALQFLEDKNGRSGNAGSTKLEPDPPGFLIEDELSNLPPASADLFYNCVYQGLSAISDGLDSERERFSTIASAIDSAIEKKGVISAVYVNGSLGTGKSVLVDKARFGLGGKHCRVFRVDPLALRADSANRDMAAFIRKSSKNLVIILDDLRSIENTGVDLISDARSGFWQSKDRSIVLVVCENWSVRPSPTPLNRANRNPQDTLVSLTRLSESEIAALLDKVIAAEKDGSITDIRCDHSRDRRLEICLADMDRHIVHVLLKIRYGTSVNAALNKEISEISDNSFLAFYRQVVLFNVLGFGAPEFLRQEAINKCSPETPFSRMEKELFKRIGDQIWIRHRIFVPRLANIFFEGVEERAFAFIKFLDGLDSDNADRLEFAVSIFEHQEISLRIKSLVSRQSQSISDIISAVDRLRHRATDSDLRFHTVLLNGRLEKEVLRDFDSARERFKDALEIRPDSGFVLRQLFWNASSDSEFPEAEMYARRALSVNSGDYITLVSAAHVLSYCSVDGFNKAGEIYQLVETRWGLSEADKRKYERYLDAKSIMDTLNQVDLPDIVLETLSAPRTVWKIRSGSKGQYKATLKRQLGGALRRRRLNPDEAAELQEEAEAILKSGGDQTLKGLLIAHSARFQYEDWYLNDTDVNFEALLNKFEEAEDYLKRDPFIPCWRGTLLKEAFEDLQAAEVAYDLAIRRQVASDFDYVKQHPMPKNNMALLLVAGVSKKVFATQRLIEARKFAKEAVKMMDSYDGDFNWPVETLEEVELLIREVGLEL